MATDACKQTDFKADYILSTLAAAYAEIGDFDSAKKYAAQAVDVTPKASDEPTRKDELKKELDCYKAGKPWRESLPEDDKKSGGDKAGAEKGEAASGDNTQPEKKQTDKPKKKKKKKKKTPPPEDAAPADKSGN